ncbi:ubiquitin-like protein Pup [Corynebacterium caspium]|uniref:ubiquitin-like protein Pup n=1 Tax=Corynebacterium caspium TaxID=234828 RepID=UPI00036BBBC7|nr:ubiquitin-like protein Pup [Corynebacterium caspium]WKD59301.1 Prokaryotic ubiquitin-like protein Pup [Corynebacterium caspium DSM 44850]
MSTQNSQVNTGGGHPADDENLNDDLANAAAQLQINSQGTDDLLDEIDSLLEENAEDFVRSYIQKGGE